MVVVKSGVDWKGEPAELYIDGILKKNLDEVIDIVTRKDWDYVSIVAGNPGVGKSNFAQTLARYCCPWFDVDHIAFDAEQFIQITNNCKPNSAIVLDESFASLNSRVSMSSDFLKIINHLQIIRQKNLFIFLCLPNFFDLAKGISIYRSHHLFVCYSHKFGSRGRFLAFSRNRKKSLYIAGGKFMNYNAVKANFMGKFYRQKFISEEAYMKKKKDHLHSQEKAYGGRQTKVRVTRDALIKYCSEVEKWKKKKIADASGLSAGGIAEILKGSQN